MKTREQVEIENLALAAELARQVCHDFRNLLYNLLLQIEIDEASPTPLNPEHSESTKRDGKKIVRLLQEWDRFHSRFMYTESPLDLHELIRRMADDASRDYPVDLAPAISAGPLSIVGSPVDCMHLLRLLVEDLWQTWQDGAGAIPTVSIRTETLEEHAIVHITASGEEMPFPANAREEATSLMAATCRSLALRLGATIQRGPYADGRCVVSVEFRLA